MKEMSVLPNTVAIGTVYFDGKTRILTDKHVITYFSRTFTP